jgi:hypothetical protein
VIYVLTHDHIGQHTPIRTEENKEEKRKEKEKFKIKKAESISQGHPYDERKQEKEGAS